MKAGGARVGRWDSLFRDLEAQIEASKRAEALTEIDERTRIELSQLRLGERLALTVGIRIRVRCLGSASAGGIVARLGAGWLLIDEGSGREAIVPMRALIAISGVPRRSEAPRSGGSVAAGLGLAHILRAVARDRSAVRLELIDGSALDGTVDRVGADFVDLAAHAAGELRRRGEVREIIVVPVTAIAMLRRDSGFQG